MRLLGQGRCGSRTLRAALVRELRHEIASCLGAWTGGIYFDMDMFYDTLQPEIVAEKAVGLDFPPEVLMLALKVHQPPRVLRAGQAFSAPVYLAWSILADVASRSR